MKSGVCQLFNVNSFIGRLNSPSCQNLFAKQTQFQFHTLQKKLNKFCWHKLLKIKYIVGFGLLSFCKYYLKIKDYLKIKLKFVNQQSLGSFFSKSIFHLAVIEGRGVWTLERGIQIEEIHSICCKTQPQLAKEFCKHLTM